MDQTNNWLINKIIDRLIHNENNHQLHPYQKYYQKSISGQNEYKRQNCKFQLDFHFENGKIKVFSCDLVGQFQVSKTQEKLQITSTYHWHILEIFRHLSLPVCQREFNFTFTLSIPNRT